MNTDDECEAFQHSVDLVVNLTDIINLRPVLRRAVAQAEFYVPFNDTKWRGVYRMSADVGRLVQKPEQTREPSHVGSYCAVISRT